MIPYEYTCNVLLLRFLGLSTLELMKELIRHSRVKSRRPMIWCSARGGLTMKVHFYFGLLCQFDILRVTFTLRLGCPPSFECDTSSLLMCNMCMCTMGCPVTFPS